ncbi:D-aminoacyl-tRNA deacylase [Natronomonas sp. LN261]|uniref:D-aminoacyl-tRNA deacylase n=1 Tax=Natronomonas sp. LN261 TaxID=2750669 RepID=UPI0015EF0166|nr:D-aminoacyl-tRNA deacylase [Natronomonas sp. LN261]
MLAVVVSRADEASEHIGEHLLEVGEWDEHEDPTRSDGNGGGRYYRTEGAELRTFEDLHLHLDGVAAAFGEPDLLLFASRHAGETGPLLTAHATGNFGPAEYGGRAGSLARAAPNALAVVRERLGAHAPAGYDVGIECTHHGPSTVGCPSLFVEVGSDEAQWRDPDAARAVARSILDLRGVSAHRERTVVGFGCGHYAPRFDRILTDTDWGVGHIAADWAIDAMGDPEDARAVIAKAFQMSGTEFAVFDGASPGIESVLERLGFEVLSETFLRETTGVPLALVERLEDALVPVESGLRFGTAAESADGFLTRALPEALLEEANGIDREAVIEALDRSTIAYETTEGATLASGSVALPEGNDDERYRAVIGAIAAILRSKYDTVEVRESSVFAARSAFDPDLAASLGVEPGPAFGRLSAGESVEVEGDRIDPADVRSARERQFSF